MLSFFSFGILIFMILLSIEVPQRFSNGMAIDKMNGVKMVMEAVLDIKNAFFIIFLLPIFSDVLCIIIRGLGVVSRMIDDENFIRD